VGDSENIVGDAISWSLMNSSILWNFKYWLICPSWLTTRSPTRCTSSEAGSVHHVLLPGRWSTELVSKFLAASEDFSHPTSWL